ncbi:hypothetical protein [Aquimarina aquimarini]|uniref:hypothetical protein n=1 Tax=Aquimarina aquimarini TaxID=1191734 RepID=UPI001F3A0989|nr:hypothetical protein [Aquimarina aquimarini]
MRSRILLLILLVLPFMMLAQETNEDAISAIDQNSTLVSQFAQLAPMGINPYITVFLTSVLSKFGIHNEYVATNPFFDNWFVIVLFGVLFLFTALVGTVVKTNKATATIGLVDDYLSNHAALLINAIIILVPTFLSNDPAHSEIVYQAGFLSVSFKTMLVLVVSMYFLVIVMTVRFFLDILIFLSPIPLVDSFLEIAKMGVTVLFVIISIVSPTVSVVISGIMFLIALLLYRRSVRLVTRTKYLFVYPILNLFRKKEKIITNGDGVLSVLVYTKVKTKKFKKGKIVRLEERDDKIFLVKNRFLMTKVEEEINVENSFLLQNGLSILLTNESGDVALLFNRSYHKYIDDIAEVLGVEIREKETFGEQLNKGVFSKIKNMFSKDDIAELELLKE